MKQRKYFDIFCALGRKCAPEKEFPYEHCALLDDMEYCRVHGAAVFSNTATEYSFIYGNQQICDIVNKEKRFVGIAAVPNTALMESGDPDYFEKLFQNGIKALAVFPDAFRCSMSAADMEQIAESLQRHKLPLILANVANQEYFSKIDLLADAFPELNIILQGTSWALNRYCFKVLERHANLYFDISTNQANDIIELSKKYFEIQRVLYSCDWPHKSMGALKSLIEYADISEAEKDMVASKNACRLLGISADDFPLYDDNECKLDEIAQEADAGLPVTVPVTDSHTHMVSSEYKTTSPIVMLNSDCDSILKKMNRMGIDTIITAPWSGISVDGRLGNSETLYAATKHPGRFLGYSTCNVNYREDLSDWKKYHDEHPNVFVGIKPYWPYQKFELTASVCEEWFDYADKHHLLLLLHTENSDKIIEDAGILSLKYPNITFILAHSGRDYSIAKKNIELAKSRDNVVLEITFTSTTRGMIEFLVEEVGADKVLYGSDLPMRDPAPQFGWVCYAKISVEEKKKILSGNICRLLEKRR